MTCVECDSRPAVAGGLCVACWAYEEWADQAMSEAAEQ